MQSTISLNDDVLAKIPAQWMVGRFKDHGYFKTGSDYQKLLPGNIPVFGSSSTPFAWVNKSLCKTASVGIGRKGTIDSPFFISANFWAMDTCMYFVLKSNKICIRFIGYCMQTITWTRISTKTALPSLTQRDVNRLLIAYPPLEEQKKIAAYLDELTALIDDQKRLLLEQIEHYKALKQSVIYEAVTKGLDPSAPMKPSGIAWIGDIPAHWQVKRARTHLQSVKTGKRDAIHGDVVGQFDFYTCSRHSAKCDTAEFSGPAILMAGNGDISNIRVIEENSKFDAYQRVYILKVKSISQKFLFYVLTALFKYHVSTLQKGSVIEFIRLKDISSFLITLPSDSEQREIVEILDSFNHNCDAILQSLENQVSLLDELKKSKIHEAVTKGL